MDALVAGDVDAVMAPRAQLEGGLAARDADTFRVSLFNLRGMLRSYWDVGVAAKAGNDDLVVEAIEALSALQQDGSLEDIAAEYGVGYVAPALDITAVARQD
jgi:ABC-type amino acid transport substrate-binding protein